ncbi:MAG: hypothetical protein DCC66_11045 [Planctomycetota bacterium]|nr:MAG: hypothetical protein DCC66_11045 [Planctomycetota bacterium]
MTARWRMVSLVGGSLLLGVGFLAFAQGPGDEKEQEVQASDLPKAALEALKKLAAGAVITKFEMEIENGVTLYEGSWKGPHGEVEAEVTAQGDLVEMEEHISPEVLPKAVLEAVRKTAGSDAKLHAEKLTTIHYEVKFTKNGKRHEVKYTPDGRAEGNEADGEDDD